MSEWTTADSEALYQIPGWGIGLFHANEAGHLVFHPDGVAEHDGIDLKKLVDDLRRRGTELPVLVRFTDIIKHRVDGLVGAFQEAIQEWGFGGRYRPVYPIKVNPQSHVMRDVMKHGAPHHVGLEAGSKPELMAVLACMEDKDALIVCNGYKDATYVRMALLAKKLGFECILVVEKPDELDVVLEVAEELGVEPYLGVRAKLNATGVNRWGSSTGDRAKFGLGVAEIVDLVRTLEEAGKLHCLRLLHFHIGSQISQVRAFRNAVREATRILVELRGMGAPMDLLDCGGGLGVDYDGTASSDSSSINYTLHEYARALVGSVQEVCDETGATPPDLVTETGRAMVAHHSVLLFDVLGVHRKAHTTPTRPKGKVKRPVEMAWEIYDEISAERITETLHEVQALRRDAVNRFNLGLLTLEERAMVERLYWATCRRILEIAGEESGNDEIEGLEQQLIDTYYANVSVFQSLPDIWAIDQLFPIVPIQRLGEEPTRRAVLADLTCDSDGKVDKFIGDREVKSYLYLHPLRKRERYVVGAFMVGAYQEILGDLHNLFGDTHAVHVAAADNARGYKVQHLDEGELVEEVLAYVHHDPKDLVRQLRVKVEAATEDGTMTFEEGAKLVKAFVNGLDDYTYLAR